MFPKSSSLPSTVLLCHLRADPNFVALFCDIGMSQNQVPKLDKKLQNSSLSEKTKFWISSFFMLKFLHKTCLEIINFRDLKFSSNIRFCDSPRFFVPLSQTKPEVYSPFHLAIKNATHSRISLYKNGSAR